MTSEAPAHDLRSNHKSAGGIRKCLDNLVASAQLDTHRTNKPLTQLYLHNHINADPNAPPDQSNLP
jgi:hypothetical protein